MKAILRNSIVVAGLAAAMFTTTAANAETAALVFTGTADIACFGCGATTCHADLTILGVTHSGSASTPNTPEGCSANEPGGGLCLVTGTASGTVVGGGLTVSFNWTRVGAVAVITTGTDVSGAGVAAFVTGAGGVTCGQPINDATIVGAIAGV